jgi:DNA-binding beta-propeller fold protein YncE
MSLNKILSFASLLLAASYVQAQDLSSIEQNRVKLPNGWSLTPVGKSLPLGDLPLNIAVSRRHRYAAVTNDGQSTQTIQLLDAKKDLELDKVFISKAWGGLVFSADEQSLYVSGGDNNWILRYSITHNKLIASDTIKLGSPWNRKKNAQSISPTGLALDDKKGILSEVFPESTQISNLF